MLREIDAFQKSSRDRRTVKCDATLDRAKSRSQMSRRESCKLPCFSRFLAVSYCVSCHPVIRVPSRSLPTLSFSVAFSHARASWHNDKPSKNTITPRNELYPPIIFVSALHQRRDRHQRVLTGMPPEYQALMPARRLCQTLPRDMILEVAQTSKTAAGVSRGRLARRIKIKKSGHSAP